ncbi:Eco57I restriction-modification methylase domain-containing protein [Bacillus haynesii]|uniref:HsdM family class I SAM-dependent methyltransferase n=1 Tax=Bacillus haynesii TaxID=1925021 RepID=UPI002281C12D|nr:Eco57I restriction-modification methylase domain-containing protein [Bacillus haynesii]MCY8344315.1 Eco57I restriction-modification methylase domain-containing protein [Bacillus haynesii]MCY8348440.1 Eco57I restriction-modification methylase domain-containing protein [Bacillus haynesii]MCY8557381.1 Eco57I restriction-modification methylase domain-containing protein [Bacillus haynesii]
MEEKRLYSSYYTKSEFITDYMIKMLDLKENYLVLEPSAGDGVFIDALIKKNPKINITAYDLNPQAIAVLNAKYNKHENIQVIESDTLLDHDLDMKVFMNGYYDRVIGNPPYGAWQDYDKRANLKNIYKGFYVKETYALFLIRCISLLKNKGKLTFIIPDTFLNLHMHNKLREYILLNTKIHEILMFPSKFFPGVNFGYSNLTIITVEKTNKEHALNNTVRIISGFKKAPDIEDITNETNLERYNIMDIPQREIFESVDMAFLIKYGSRIRNLINNPQRTLGDVADCVTGIYTGNNKAYFKALNSQVKNPTKCGIVDENKIEYDYLKYDNLLDGIEGDKHFIPVTKGNAEMYYRKNEWFIDWGKDALHHYRTDKKARFQNSRYYFRKGIAVPMVKSSKVKANLINNQVFDQSVVGIFPKEKKYLYYLLALLNSDIVNTIIQTINHTANNSANYLKKVPIVLPNNEKDIEHVNVLVKKMIKHIERTDHVDEEIQKELNQIFSNLYSKNELPAKILV